MNLLQDIRGSVERRGGGRGRVAGDSEIVGTGNGGGEGRACGKPQNTQICNVCI
jgi:hypothetical protein